MRRQRVEECRITINSSVFSHHPFHKVMVLCRLLPLYCVCPLPFPPFFYLDSAYQSQASFSEAQQPYQQQQYYQQQQPFGQQPFGQQSETMNEIDSHTDPPLLEGFLKTLSFLPSFASHCFHVWISFSILLTTHFHILTIFFISFHSFPLFLELEIDFNVIKKKALESILPFKKSFPIFNFASLISYHPLIDYIKLISYLHFSFSNNAKVPEFVIHFLIHHRLRRPTEVSER